MTTTTADELREEVRRRYADSARAVSERTGSASCGGGGCCADGSTDAASFGEALYDADQRGGLPEAATLASLGCGNPTAVADLREGETVLDLGSGGGIDVILSARRVGEQGRAYGIDMTDEMLELAQRNAEEAGVRNAIFLKGVIEQVPSAGELCRRRDLELRDQPLDRQGRGARRDGASPATGGSRRRQRRRRRGPALAGRPRGARQLRRVHRRCAVGGRVHRRARGSRIRAGQRRVHPSRWPTGCTVRSSRRSSRTRPRQAAFPSSSRPRQPAAVETMSVQLDPVTQIHPEAAAPLAARGIDVGEEFRSR